MSQHAASAYRAASSGLHVIRMLGLSDVPFPGSRADGGDSGVLGYESVRGVKEAAGPSGDVFDLCLG